MSDSRYTYDNAQEHARRQVRLLGEILDGHARDVLSGVGVRPGWRCLEIGPGAGTITQLLSEQVGPDGHVTSVDLDPRYVEPGPNIDVRTDDIRTMDLPEGRYDLIYARLVLMHVTGRDDVVRRLAAALRPGGVLVLSDWDCTWRDWVAHTATPEAAEAFVTLQDTLLGLMESNGTELAWARRAPVAMRAAGLAVETTVFNKLFAGDEAGALLQHNNTYQLQDALLGRGMTMKQLDLVREAMVDPETLIYTYLMFSSVGRKA
ncbi:class I SAM-dependent methyltransferase [Kribbella sp. NPDC051770]|uniref:class I SAM-dependent methyltransferase n=1 Tax=Kribbella sp. NPDC051770 TaxID=3155413 RepID=UPI003428F8EC